MRLLEIDDLYVSYTLQGKIEGSRVVNAVNGVNLEVNRGEILSIAGESGCGKSTLAKSIMNLVDIDSGEIIFNDKNIANTKKTSNLKDFYRKIQMVFQNPYSSLNPKMKVGQILSEPLEINTNLSKSKIAQIVKQKLKDVGLSIDVLNLYPHEFSGGQRQRIAIARALVLNPELIIADEPVSALDVSIQAQIINLIKNLNDNLNITFLFISHDLRIIRYISDKIAIMYLGEIVEIGQTEEIFTNPKHPYTKALLSAIPEFKGEDNNIEKLSLNGEPTQNLPSGCKFHTRCPYVMDKCKFTPPNSTEFSSTHNCRCYLYQDEIQYNVTK